MGKREAWKSTITLQQDTTQNQTKQAGVQRQNNPWPNTEQVDRTVLYKGTEQTRKQTK